MAGLPQAEGFPSLGRRGAGGHTSIPQAQPARRDVRAPLEWEDRDKTQCGLTGPRRQGPQQLPHFWPLIRPLPAAPQAQRTQQLGWPSQVGAALSEEGHLRFSHEYGLSTSCVPPAVLDGGTRGAALTSLPASAELTRHKEMSRGRRCEPRTGRAQSY